MRRPRYRMVEKLIGRGPTDSKWWNWDLNSNPRASTLTQSCCFGHYVNAPLWNSAGSLPLPHRAQQWVIQAYTCERGRKGLLGEKTGQVRWRAPWMRLKMPEHYWIGNKELLENEEQRAVKTKWMNVGLVNSCHIILLGKDGKTISPSRIFGSVWICISRISGSFTGTDNSYLYWITY